MNKDIFKLEYLAKKYNETNIPLYLSYPTVSWWKSNVEQQEFINYFKNQCNSQINNYLLYFHFPYCKKACYYCCCYKAITTDESKKDKYIKYLEKEFQYKMDLLEPDTFSRIKHMHWGGGTPTYMSCKQLEKIFNVISRRIGTNKSEGSISIESYPDDEMINIEKLKLLQDLGFNEISFGIQDFDSRVQQVINRDCRTEVVEKIIDWAKDLGFRIHIDLCYGLPFQGLNEIEKTVNKLVKMNPDRIILFPYVHYPLIFPLQRMIPMQSLPNSFIKVLLLKTVKEILISSGYYKVGYNHFVKQENPLYIASKEKKIVHDFMGYSVLDRKQFIGFGSSAISSIGNRFFHNASSIESYCSAIEDNKIPLEKELGHALTEDDLIRNNIIQRDILCNFLIKKNEIEKKFNIYFDDYFKYELKKLKEYEADGLVHFPDTNTIKITSWGKYFVRHVAHVFDRYYRS